MVRSSMWDATAHNANEKKQCGELISGTAISAAIRKELSLQVQALVHQSGEVARPGLAVLLIGNRTDSQSYVRAKKKVCKEIGISDISTTFPAEISQRALISKIDELHARVS